MADNSSGDLLLVGTYRSRNVETLVLPSTPGTSTSLEVPSDQYGSMQAGTRDVRYNLSLTDPPQYPGVPVVASSASATPFTNELLSMHKTGNQQQQRVNEWSESLLSEYCLLLKRITDSMDEEQVKSLCSVSVEAMKAGICNRDDFSGTVLFDFFHQKMLISPNVLTYLTKKLHAIDRLDLCSLIDQYNSRMLSPQPLPHGDPPVDERPPNPEFVSAPIHGQSHPYPVHHVPSSNTVQSIAPMLGGLSEQSSYSLPCQVQEDNVIQMGYNHSAYLGTSKSNHAQSRLGNGFESPCETVTYLTNEQLHIKQLEEQMACLKSKLKDVEEQLDQQKDRTAQHEVTIDKLIHIDKCKNELFESLIDLPVHPVKKYNMNKIPHGIAVIINNSNFYSLNPAFKPLPGRPGSCVDEEHLYCTWKYLSYDVCILRNLTAADLTQRLKQIAQLSHENYDSFVCCILSHGYCDGVHGADGEPVEISDIADLFKPTNCPTLAGKPKMFFIQACRGTNIDPGYVLKKDGNDEPFCNSLPNEDPGYSVENDVKGDHDEEPFGSSLPNDADFLFGYSTPPGNVSWRSHRHGSWYISSLCEVLTKYALHQDLFNMLTIVNHRVSEAYITDKDYKQCPSLVTQLRKQLWFFS